VILSINALISPPLSGEGHVSFVLPTLSLP
jgi:hypothetical protein